MALLIKNVTTYQKTKPLYEAYRKARNKEKYRAEHERGIILHKRQKKKKKSRPAPPPPPPPPHKRKKKKKAEKKVYADYGKLKKQVAEYDVIKRNIDSILQAEKQTERKEKQNGNKVLYHWKNKKIMIK